MGIKDVRLSKSVRALFKYFEGSAAAKGWLVLPVDTKFLGTTIPDKKNESDDTDKKAPPAKNTRRATK